MTDAVDPAPAARAAARDVPRLVADNRGLAGVQGLRGLLRRRPGFGLGDSRLSGRRVYGVLHFVYGLRGLGHCESVTDRGSRRHVRQVFGVFDNRPALGANDSYCVVQCGRGW